MKHNDFRETLYKKHPNKIKKHKKIIPNEKLKIIGITGSHGKSTTGYLLHKYIKSIGYKSILYSSIMIDSPTSKYINNTAVEIPINGEEMLYNALTEATETKSDYLILEINDSTISKEICDELEFDLKILTNIEPLENQMYEDYVGLKKKFIKEGNHKTVIGLMHPETINLYNEIKEKDVMAYTTEFFIQKRKLDEKEISFYLKPYQNKYHSFKGLEFEVIGFDKPLKVKTNLNMPFHGINLTCLITALNALKIFEEKVFKKFVENIIIPGRDEIIKYKKGYVMISYTSIPQLKVLKGYQEKGEIAKITLITGASGNIFPTWNKEYQSERYKEQMEYDMKFAYDYAVKYADEIIITTNDSGNNDISELLTKQENLVKGKKAYLVIKSRYEAIQEALKKITSKEVIFISGRANRELMCEDNKVKKHIDKEVVLEIVGQEEQKNV